MNVTLIFDLGVELSLHECNFDILPGCLALAYMNVTLIFEQAVWH
jgi:hypothetical protein